MRVYGLTLDERDQLLATGCAVCGETEKKIMIDHCHKTGSVRGALCHGCNVALGGAKDDPSLLRALADYLEEERHISQGKIGPAH